MDRPRILVVDDDGDVRDMLSEFLAHDYSVDTAENGMEALSAVMTAEQKVDLVVADLNMPEMNGVELMAALPEGTPVIVISAHLGHSAFDGRIDDLNPEAVFSKPFSVTGLEHAIRAALDK